MTVCLLFIPVEFDGIITAIIQMHKVVLHPPTPSCLRIIRKASSVTFEKNGRRAYFHRPHPQREVLKYRVKVAREFLIKLQIIP